MKIAICIPVYEDTKASFTLSLANMIAVTMEQFAKTTPPIVPEITTYIRRGLLPYSRLHLAADAYKADYVLWLDSDMVFHPSTFLMLFNHHLELVGTNCHRKTEDVSYTAMRGGEYVATTENSPPLEEVDYLGLAVCLLKGETFRRIFNDAIETNEPLFAFAPAGGEEKAVSEDYYFFARAKKLGIPVHVDHALSRQVGHITETVLRL